MRFKNDRDSDFIERSNGGGSHVHLESLTKWVYQIIEEILVETKKYVRQNFTTQEKSLLDILESQVKPHTA